SSFDQVPDTAELLGPHLARIRDAPVLPHLRAHVGTRVAASHRHGGVELDRGEVREWLRALLREVATLLPHRFDRLRVNPPRRSRARAEGFDTGAPEFPRERFGHLAAVR